jgi:DNA-binding MarR family transcriptional regulator
MDNYRELFLMQQVYATLFSLTNKIQGKGDSYMDHLTSRQFMAMMAVAHLSEEETSLNNVARKLGSTKQSVKQMVIILENKGYVKVVSSSKDKRAVNISITDSGKQALLEDSKNGILFLAELFTEFSTEEMETFWGLLKKLYRFDGEQQDGFEEESRLEVTEDQRDTQMKALKEFDKRRSYRGVENSHEEYTAD